MSRLAPVVIDLSALPLPSAVEALDQRTLFSIILRKFIELDPTYEVLVEGDPAVKVLEVGAHREMFMRARVNDAVKAVLLSTSYGSNLDALGARFGVYRMLITPGDDTVFPPVEAVYESDDAFRKRVQLAPEAWAGAGPLDAYRYHAFSVDGRITDVAVYNHSSGIVPPGTAKVVLLADDMNIMPELVSLVTAHLNRDDIRPLTDVVNVSGASAKNFVINAVLHTGVGPDPLAIRNRALANVQSYIASRRKVGAVVAHSGIEAALHVTNVERVSLLAPVVDVQPELDEYANLLSLSLRVVADA